MHSMPSKQDSFTKLLSDMIVRLDESRDHVPAEFLQHHTSYTQGLQTALEAYINLSKKGAIP